MRKSSSISTTRFRCAGRSLACEEFDVDYLANGWQVEVEPIGDSGYRAAIPEGQSGLTGAQSKSCSASSQSAVRSSCDENVAPRCNQRRNAAFAISAWDGVGIAASAGPKTSTESMRPRQTSSFST